jgi:hypothetical protein
MNTTKSARHQFAEILAFHFKERKLNLPYVARQCRTTSTNVEGWLSGSLIPDSNEWEQLHRKVSRELTRYGDLWRDARSEAKTERETVARAMSNGARSSVNRLADKLGPALAAVPTVPIVEAPGAGPKNPGAYAEAWRDLGLEPAGTAKDGRTLPPPRPAGAMNRDQVAQRTAFVRDILRQRPHAPAGGKDGILAVVRKTFGVGISPDTIEEERAKLERERLEAEVRAKLLAEMAQPAVADPPADPIASPAPVVTPQSAPAPAAPAPVAQEPDEREIDAGVQMITSAIPGLARLLIEVNEAGEASYTYEVRTTRTGRGSVKR